MMGQISPAGFQSLESLYFWYVTIEINDFLNLNLNLNSREISFAYNGLLNLDFTRKGRGSDNAFLRAKFQNDSTTDIIVMINEFWWDLS